MARSLWRSERRNPLPAIRRAFLRLAGAGEAAGGGRPNSPLLANTRAAWTLRLSASKGVGSRSGSGQTKAWLKTKNPDFERQ